MESKSKNMSNKGILILFVLLLFCSSSFATNVIDMRTQHNNNNVEKVENNTEILLFNNYINTIDNDKVIKSIAPYYNDIVLNIDNYSMTIYFNDSGISKIIEGESTNYDMKIELDKEQIIYFFNNYYKMNTFDKIKYIINLNIPIGDVIRLSGIAMSVK